MRCVSGLETWGRAGPSSREGIAVAHSGNRPDSERQCGSSDPSPTTPCPRRSDITPTPPFTLNDHSQVRPGLPTYVVQVASSGCCRPTTVAMVTVSGGVGG